MNPTTTINSEVAERYRRGMAKPVGQHTGYELALCRFESCPRYHLQRNDEHTKG